MWQENDEKVHPRSLTWPLKNHGWKTRFLWGWYIFRGYVKLQECTYFTSDHLLIMFSLDAKQQNPRSSLVHCLHCLVFCAEILHPIKSEKYSSKLRKSNDLGSTRWFKVTFSSPSWRSLNPFKGSLNHPKKVTLNHQVPFFLWISHSRTALFLAAAIRGKSGISFSQTEVVFAMSVL